MQVDEVREVVLGHLQQPGLAGAPLVLRGPALPAALLEHHARAGETELGADHVERLGEAAARLVRVDLGRRRVLLHVSPVPVHVDDQVVLGQVGVVEAVAGDALALQAAGETAPVLAQPVGQILGAAAQQGPGRAGAAGRGAARGLRCSDRRRGGRARGRPGAAGCGRPGRGRAGLVVGEHAVEGPVAQRGLASGGEAERAELTPVAGEHDRGPAGEGGAQPLAELSVDGLGLRGVEPLAVRRVGGEQPAAGGRHDRGQLRLFERHEVAQPGSSRAVPGETDGARIVVAAADTRLRPRRREPREARVAPLARFGEQRVPGPCVVAPPAQEAEGRGRSAGPAARTGALALGAQQPRRHVTGHERRLDGQRARPAERVHQAAPGAGLLRPGRVEQHAGGQVLLQRRLRLHLVGAVAAPVQAVSAQVDREGHAAAGEVRIDADVRGVRVDRRPAPATLLAQAVDDRVLDPHRAEPGVADAPVGTAEVHRQRLVGAEVLTPVDGPRDRVQLVAVPGDALRQRQQDPAGEPRPETGAVGGLEGAPERDAGADLPHVRRAERPQLAGEHRLEPARDRGEQGEVAHPAHSSHTTSAWASTRAVACSVLSGG